MKTTKQNKLLFFILAISFFSIEIYAAEIRPVASGLWTSTDIWPNGIKPTVNDDVIVPQGIDLIMVGTCRAKTITVMGKLSAVNWQADGAWIDLETHNIRVMNNGIMEMGTLDQPYHANQGGVITLLGNRAGGTGPLNKAIMVMGGGRLELHGKRKMSWTNLAVTANAGSNQITLKETIDWEVGDVIALTSTDVANKATKSWENVDQVEIESISGDRKTITLTEPLRFKHIGGSRSYTRPTDGKTWNMDIYGEVGLLSHYIKIQGKMDGNNNADGFGGHTMFMKGSTVHVENIELYKMGQKGVLARYPFHWHLNEDAAEGSYIKNSSIHQSFNRVVTIHGTDYVTVDGIFAYDHIGHGIFFEDGGERFNTIKNNVLSVTRRPKLGEELTPSDNFSDNPSQGDSAQNRTPSSYWITNPNNYFENNVAAGTEGTGFWFAFPEGGPMGLSSNLNYFNGIIPWKQPLGSFEGFVAHTCMNGFDIFDRLNPNHSIKRNWGWDISNEQYISEGIFYGNDQAIYCGLDVGGDPKKVVFKDCAFSDNKIITMLAANITIENSLFSSNTGLGVFEGTRSFYRYYDGPGRHFDCHFEGWNRSDSDMIFQRLGGGATPNVNPSFRGTTKGFSEPFTFKHVGVELNTRPRQLNQYFKDYDGGLLGKANTTLVRDIPFNTDGHEYKHNTWVNSARSDYFFATTWLHKMRDAAVAIVRSKPGTEDVCIWDVGQAGGTYKYGVIVNEGFTYNYSLRGLPVGKEIHIIMDYGEVGDLSMSVYKGLGKLDNFRVQGSGIQELNSVAAIESATNNAYYIANNGDVYVKMRGTATRTNVFLRWNGNGSYQAPNPPCNGSTEQNSPPRGSFLNPTVTEIQEGYEELYVAVNAFDPNPDTVSATLFIDGNEIRREGAAPYEWGAAGQNIEETLGLEIGEHLLEAVIVDQRGASTTISQTITVIERTLSTDDVEDPDRLLLYPNPTNSLLTLKSKSQGNIEVEISDLSGKLILTRSLNSQTNILDLSKFSSGMYLLTFKDEIGSKVFKVIKR